MVFYFVFDVILKDFYFKVIKMVYVLFEFILCFFLVDFE